MRKHHSREDRPKNTWQIQEAKAKFSEVIEEASRKGYQTITKRGEPIAIIISKREFDKITQSDGSLLEFFMSAPFSDIELDIQRSRDLPREIDL
jgi:antitoxin Phd